MLLGEFIPSSIYLKRSSLEVISYVNKRELNLKVIRDKNRKQNLSNSAITFP
jgi:hypothetical protein